MQDDAWDSTKNTYNKTTLKKLKKERKKQGKEEKERERGAFDNKDDGDYEAGWGKANQGQFQGTFPCMYTCVCVCVHADVDVYVPYIVQRREANYSP